MNRLTLLGLLVLFAAVGGVAWWQADRERSGAFLLEIPLFEDVRPEDVVAFRIDNIERHIQVELELRSGEWWMTDPLEVPADAGVAERLLEIVERNRALVVPREEADAEALGLEPPRAIFDVLALRDGEPVRHRVEVGLRDLDGRGLFVRSRGRLLRTMQNLDTQIDKEVHDYRSKRIVDLPAESVSEVSRVGSYQDTLEDAPVDLKLLAVREGAAWRSLMPYEAALDPLAVSILVVGTSRLPVERFIEDAAPDVERYGLATPGLSIDLATGGGRRATVHIARQGFSSTWYATREDRRVIYEIPPDDVAPLLLPIEEMLDLLILRLARHEVDRIVLETPERVLRVERGERGWTVAERPQGEPAFGPPRGADPRRVDELLGRLEGSELAGFLPGEPFPEEAPRLAVHVEARGVVFGGRLGPETEDAGGAPARLYQRVGDEIVSLVGPWMAELAALPIEELLDPLLLSIEEIHVAALRLERAGGVRRFVRDERGAWRPEGEGEEAHELLPLLDPLLFLRAAEHLDASAPPPLDRELRVVFEESSGAETAFTLGLAPGPGGEPRAEARVGAARASLRHPELHAGLEALLQDR